MHACAQVHAPTQAHARARARIQRSVTNARRPPRSAARAHARRAQNPTAARSDGERRGLWRAHGGLLRGGLEGGEARVVGTAGLVVVAAVAVGGHVCEVHSVAALVQPVADGPVGAVVLTVAVDLARGKLAVLCVPAVPLE